MYSRRKRCSEITLKALADGIRILRHMFRGRVKVVTLIVTVFFQFFVISGYSMLTLTDEDNDLRKKEEIALLVAAKEKLVEGDLEGARFLFFEIERKLDENSPKRESLARVRRSFPVFYPEIVLQTVKGHHEKARHMIDERLQEDKEDYVALNHLGEIYWDQGRRKRAIWNFRKSLRVNGDYPPARFNLGKAYYFERKLEKAISQMSVYEENISALPPFGGYAAIIHAERLSYISEIYERMGRYDEALVRLEEALKFRPDSQQILYNIGILYYTRKRRRFRAFEYFKKVIELDPDSQLGGMAEYALDYMRRNPDSRVLPDFGFVYER